MELTINGNTQQVVEGSRLPKLLESLGLKGKPVVIELNREALAPEQHTETILQNGDHLEIVILAAGG